MAGIKISALPAVPSAQLTDVFPVVQSGTTYQESNQQLLTLFQSNGAALTNVNDTNVTLTLGGSPTTALLNSTSLTLGWTGLLGIARGGTGVSSVTISPTSTAFAGWDANSNLSASNFLSGYTTTATAAAVTTLTIASTYYQYFTGSTTQTCVLPHTSTVLGTSYYIVNNSTGVVTVNASGGQTVVSMGASSSALVTCISAGGTTSASWNAQYVIDADVSNAVLLAPSSNQTITGAHNLILSAGNFIAGNTTAPLTGIPIQAVGAIGVSGISAVFSYNNTGNFANFISYKSASATVGSYSTVGSSEPLGSWSSYGDDGTQFTRATAITALSNGTVSSGVVPGQLQFSTANSSGVLTLGATLSSAQILTLVNPLPVASGGTGITAFGTGVATALASNVNGSGAISLTTSPTFVTPVLGAAAATSINFGGSTLANYVTAGTFTPVFTFTTPGDLSVVYATQVGLYTRIGNIVTVSLNLVCTPTFTTSSGSLSISGFPIGLNATSGNLSVSGLLMGGFSYPATATQVYGYFPAGATAMQAYGVTPTGTNPQVSTSQFTTGVQISINATFTYLV